MPFYAFRLNSIDCVNQRGKLPDDDIITFQVTINGAARGLAATRIESVTSGETEVLASPRDPATPFTPIPPTTRTNARTDWIIGPFEIAPTDNVAVGFSGTNYSDWELGTDSSDQDKITLALANAFFKAMAGLAIDGVTGALAGLGVAGVTDLLGKLSDALGAVADPVSKLLGVHAQGPCNGIVFAGAQAFSGADLSRLQFQPPAVYASLQQAVELAFATQTLDDGANHNTDTCGHIAGTVIHWSALQIPAVPLNRYFPQSLAGGLRQYATPHQDLHLRSFLHLRP